MSHVDIRPESPDSDAARALIGELDAFLIPLGPRESHHGYPVEKLIAHKVAFYVARCDGVPAGCGGLQECDGFAEVKRMYVRPAFRGQGLARRILAVLEEHARRQGLSVLRLETGAYLKEAIGLYLRSGFVEIPPFPPYRADPWSRFFERRLE